MTQAAPEEATVVGNGERTTRGGMRGLTGDAITLVGFGAALLFLAGGLGRWWWIAELCSHFRPHFAVVLGVTGAALLCWRRWRSAALLLIVGLIAALPVLALYTGGGDAPAGAPTLRLMSANVLTSNGDAQRLLEQVEVEDPDILVLLEVNQAWLDRLELLGEAYPHRLTHPRDNNFGIAVFSRFPGTLMKLESLGDPRFASVVAEFDWRERHVVLIATHPLPPIGSKMAQLRNEQLREVGARAAEAMTTGSAVVMGDLNITPWSPQFRDLLKHGQLRDSAQGHGPQPTWPAGSRLLRLPIDHCLHSADLVTVDRRVGQDIGSDHLPIVVDLTLAEDGD